MRAGEATATRRRPLARAERGGGSPRATPVTVGILTTKELQPPKDGRADSVWKMARLLSREEGLRVVLLSLCPQPPTVVERFETILVPWKLSLSGFLRGLGKGFPIQVSLYENPALQDRLVREAAGLDLDVVISDMARTGLLTLALPSRRRILDMDDRLSRRYRRQAERGGAGSGFGQVPRWLSRPAAWAATRFERPILRFEAARLARFEEILVEHFEAVVLVSRLEADELAEATGKRIHAIPNYVELSPVPSGLPRDPATLLFFGNLSTAHNVDTAVHLARDIFPEVRRSVPEAKLELVGRNMSARVARLNGLDGVSVHADVPRIDPFLARATVCVSPMRFGSGIKTKLLEALHAGLPVVTSPVGAEGIPGADSCMIVEEDPARIAAAAVSVLSGERPVAGMVEAGRRVVATHFSREAVRSGWLSLIRGPEEGDQGPPA